MANINIGGRLHSTATGNTVAGANEILDDSKGKKQSVINQETDEALAGKQATIEDLSTIRSGAAAGATAYQKPGTGIPATDMASGVQTSLGKADTAYQKPGAGVPKTDLESGVQASLDLADSAIQARPMGAIDPTITPADYATKEELDELEAKVTDISDKMPLPADITGTISTQSSDPGYGLYIKANGTVESYSTYMISNPITLHKGDRFLSSSRAGSTQIFAKYLGDYSTFDPISGYYVNSNTTYQIDWIADEDCQVVVCGERASLGDYTIKPGGYDYCASKGATILGWILAESFSVSNATYTDGVVNSPVSVTWPDGVNGALTLVRDSGGNVTSATAVHGTDTFVLTVTRDSDGNVTDTTIQ